MISFSVMLSCGSIAARFFVSTNPHLPPLLAKMGTYFHLSCASPPFRQELPKLGLPSPQLCSDIN